MSLTDSFQVKSEALKENPIKKFEEMFERRASQGQCFMQPYLGCREFSAYFQLISTKMIIVILFLKRVI